MAAIATKNFEGSERLRLFERDVADRRGLILSHLLGLALFSEFTLNIFKFSLPFTPANSIPIRLILIWLLIDRTGRIGRIRADFWDYVNVGFVLMTGLGLVITATSSPQVPVSFDDYRKFIGLFTTGYVYFLVAKEGLNRRGFRPDITINWLIAGLSWSALVGLMQAANLLHARQWSQLYSSANLSWLRAVGDESAASLASGTAPWWNTMALEMLMAFALVFGPVFIRRPKWWEWWIGGLFMMAFIATQSRGGLAAFAACGIATFWWYAFHKKYKIALIIGSVFAVGVAIWLFAVFALKIERFTRTIQGEKVRGSVYAQSIDNRIATQGEAFRIGMKSPIFGTGPSFSLFAGPAGKVDIYSPYAIRGAIDGTYGLVFAQFGLMGIGFLLSMQGYLIAFIRRKVAYRPYAFAAFFVGVAFSVHGVVEYLIYGRPLIILGVLAAYAGSRYLASEKGRLPVRREVKTSHLQANI